MHNTTNHYINHNKGGKKLNIIEEDFVKLYAQTSRGGLGRGVHAPTLTCFSSKL